MSATPVSPNLADQLQKLKEKYGIMGQDISSYLDGLLYSDYLTYWDYIHVDTLLSLQTPKTSFPDEKIFIMYHQITELYFKLILHEIEQLSNNEQLNEHYFINHLDRIIRYFRLLENSFAVMVDGMDKDQFLKFRMSLLPASGFQSAQYRMIELTSTSLINLTHATVRESLASQPHDIDHLLHHLYWRSGASELASGKKTLTLQQFEQKYMASFKHLASQYEHTNLYSLFNSHFATSAQRDEIVSRLREYDMLANVKWRKAHLRSAGRYLQKNPEDIKATGGTNWQKYLPPRFQRVVFFPNLWTTEELTNWGM